MTAQVGDLIIFYGSLKEDVRSEEVLVNVASYGEYLAQCRFFGKMYENEGEPVVTDGDMVCEGQLFKISDTAIIDELDSLRAIGSDHSDYRREKTRILGPDNSPSDQYAWIYRWAGDADSLTLIPNGYWSDHVGSHADEYGSYATSPGGLRFSPELFKRWLGLRPLTKLAMFFLRTRNFHEEQIAWQIDCCDTNPAIVLETGPRLLIAVYAEDLDASVVLEYPRAFVKRFKLTVGDRLISINSYRDPYAPEFSELADDIVPGPNYSGWSNVQPMVGNFLCDDQTRIAQKVAAIDEGVWSTLSDRAETYLECTNGKVRDGFPTGSDFSAEMSGRAKRKRARYAGNLKT